MNLPSKLLEQAVNEISRMPGIGKKSALRIALHLLRQPSDDTARLAEALNAMRQQVRYCKQCFNLSDAELCSICAGGHRDEQTVCVVQDIRDVMAIENTGQYRGLYHVLGGVISPLDGIGPDDINAEALVRRVAEQQPAEIILALSPTMEGDTTAFYLQKLLKPYEVKITTIARGIPVGNELEYADEVTLGRSILARTRAE